MSAGLKHNTALEEAAIVRSKRYARSCLLPIMAQWEKCLSLPRSGIHYATNYAKKRKENTPIYLFTSL